MVLSALPSLGLEAVGSTAVLRERLLGHYGFLRENRMESSPQEVEVSAFHELYFDKLESSDRWKLRGQNLSFVASTQNRNSAKRKE